MNRDDTYKELTRKLRESKVKFVKKEAVGQEVLSKISEGRDAKKILLKSFYSWTEVKWLRWSISTAAVLFIAIFFSQQVTISKRLSNLERQLVKTESNVQFTKESISPTQRVILNLISDRKFDSVTVSKEALEDLFKEYMNLQEENENLKKKAEIEQLMNSYTEDQSSSETNKKL